MNEPTSGPWEVAKSLAREFYLDEWYIEADALMDDGVPGMVAIVNGEANAHRVAAAPEMMEACEAWYKGHLEGLRSCGCIECAPFVAAIAKAKGLTE